MQKAVHKASLPRIPAIVAESGVSYGVPSAPHVLYSRVRPGNVTLGIREGYK